MHEPEKRALLDIARAAISGAARHAVLAPTHPAAGSPLDAPGAAFVTIHDSHGGLRGCVGTTSATRPLYETVHEMAKAAAIRDPRFEAVGEDEVAGLDVEISVLEPLERIHSLAEVEIGRHGLVVEGRGRRGLLLPQVASERNWDPTTFAEQTCRKAGLDAHAYEADDISVYRFTTEIIAG